MLACSEHSHSKKMGFDFLVEEIYFYFPCSITKWHTFKMVEAYAYIFWIFSRIQVQSDSITLCTPEEDWETQGAIQPVCTNFKK